MLQVQEMCSNLYYPFCSDSKRLFKIQEELQEFFYLCKSSKDSLAKELMLRKVNGPITIVDAFEPLIFRVFEEIFQVPKKEFLLSASILKFVKLTSNGLVS